MSEMYWLNQNQHRKAIEHVFYNDLLLEQEEYTQTLRALHAFKYWTELNQLNCVEVLQHPDLHPFYFGCISIINGLFENSHGQLSAAKHAFEAIPKEKVADIYDAIEKFKQEANMDASHEEVEQKSNSLIFNYIHALMEQMFQDTLAKIAKTAWGQIALFQFDDARQIAQKMLTFDDENVIAFGVLLRLETEQAQYATAVETFEKHIGAEKC
eukprot:CAMPEP_0202734758 /NCGR_PEP_ID=MMETSP1385-20130828/188852_1 /ASSEMBLY_ACC=CAM_ASM_000861 /TAXON_ID=933848 /ORGANISM="Elphidium margaritaceum" /LENGTH=211 /DNA_ID=CAMNT_0049401139 /DNA_START=188 /DNA_END=820 /DNA_ORIENTATION=-